MISLIMMTYQVRCPNHSILSATYSELYPISISNKYTTTNLILKISFDCVQESHEDETKLDITATTIRIRRTTAVLKEYGSTTTHWSRAFGRMSEEVSFGLSQRTYVTPIGHQCLGNIPATRVKVCADTLESRNGQRKTGFLPGE
jgi:hypothetical protein